MNEPNPNEIVVEDQIGEDGKPMCHISAYQVPALQMIAFAVAAAGKALNDAGQTRENRGRLVIKKPSGIIGASPIPEFELPEDTNAAVGLCLELVSYAVNAMAQAQMQAAAAPKPAATKEEKKPAENQPQPAIQ